LYSALIETSIWAPSPGTALMTRKDWREIEKISVYDCPKRRRGELERNRPMLTLDYGHHDQNVSSVLRGSRIVSTNRSWLSLWENASVHPSI
jgi:UDP-N-acetylmuramate-alanine ligase